MLVHECKDFWEGRLGYPQGQKSKVEGICFYLAGEGLRLSDCFEARIHLERDGGGKWVQLKNVKEDTGFWLTRPPYSTQPLAPCLTGRTHSYWRSS